MSSSGGASVPSPPVSASGSVASQQRQQQQPATSTTRTPEEQRKAVALREEQLIVWLWLHTDKRTFKETINKFMGITQFPRPDVLAAKNCKLSSFNKIAMSWMVRNGLVESERDVVTANQLLRSDKYTRSMYTDNHGMFWNISHPPDSYKACYNRLREFVHSSKKCYKDELNAVLFPVVFWLVFELLTYSSGGDGSSATTKIAAAHDLLDAVSAEHYEQYKRELLALRSSFKEEHLLESHIIQSLEANAIVLSQMTSQLLYDFVKSDCTNHSDNTLMRIVFLKLQIKVKGGPAKRVPGRSETRDWSIANSNDSTHFCGFAYAESGRGEGVAAEAKSGSDLRKTGLWDAPIEKKVCEMLGTLNDAGDGGGLADDLLVPDVEKEKEVGKKKKKKDKDGGGDDDGEGGGGGKKRKMTKKQEEMQRKQESLKAAAAASGAGKVLFREMPRPKLSDETIEELATSVAKRKTVSAKSLPSVCFYTVGNTSEEMNSAGISIDGKLVAACLNDSSVHMWDVSKREHSYNDSDEQQRNSFTDDVAVDAGGGNGAKRAAFGGESGRHVSDAGDWEESSAWCRPWKGLHGHQGAVYGADITYNNRFVASCGEDGTVRIWSMDTETNILCLRGHNYPVWDVSWSFESFYLASSSYDGTARLWSIHHHYPLRMFVGHSGDVDCCRFHPNCNYLVSGGADKTVRMWDANSGGCARLMKGHLTGVTAVSVSPDGKMLSSGGENGEIHVWDIGMEKRVYSLKGHSDAVTSLDYCRGEGSVLASASVDCSICLWDLKGSVGATQGASKYKVPELEWAAGSTAAGPSDEKSSGGGVATRYDASNAETLHPIRKFRTLQTPVVSLRYSLTNIIFAVGAREELQ